MEIKRRIKIINDIFGHFGTNLFVQIFSLARGAIIAKFLGPYLFGIWNGLMLILFYSPYANLGLTNAMDREYPYYVAKKEEEKAEKIKDVAFTCGNFISAVLAIFIVITAFYLRGKVPTVVSVGLLVMAVATFLQMFYSYYKELLRIDKRIKPVNVAMVLFSVINCLFSIMLVARFRLYGVYTAFLLAYGISIAYILLNTRHCFRLRIDRAVTRHLLKIGIPLMLINLTGAALQSADKVMILKFLTLTELGYYGISMLFIGFILYIPLATQFVTYPYLLEKFGQTQEAAALRSYIIPPTILLSYLISFSIGIILITIHLPIKYFLASFLPGLDAIKIIIAGNFFYALIHLPVNFLVTLRKHNKVILIQSLLLILNIILNYVFISSGMGIKGVALGTTISYLFLTTIVMGYAVKHLIKEWAALAKFFITLYFPFIYVLSIIFVLNTFMIKNAGGLANDLKLTSLKLLFFIIFSAPILRYIQKQKLINSR